MTGREVEVATPPFGTLRVTAGQRRAGWIFRFPFLEKASVHADLHLVVGSTLIIWTAAYYRLKEKQV